MTSLDCYFHKQSIFLIFLFDQILTFKLLNKFIGL